MGIILILARTRLPCAAAALAVLALAVAGCSSGGGLTGPDGLNATEETCINGNTGELDKGIPECEHLKPAEKEAALKVASNKRAEAEGHQYEKASSDQHSPEEMARGRLREAEAQASRYKTEMAESEQEDREGKLSTEDIQTVEQEDREKIKEVKAEDREVAEQVRAMKITGPQPDWLGKRAARRDREAQEAVKEARE